MNPVVIGKATLYNMDCMELLKATPDKFYDLAIVDPPYGIDAANMTMGKGSANDLGIHKKKNWDKEIPTADYFNELFRVRKNQIVWDISTQSCSEAHFAVMPEVLVEPCILAGSKVGDIVFDPFMGSGTVGKVAQHLGRKWLGAELNPEYIKIQNKRTSQQSLELVA